MQFITDARVDVKHLKNIGFGVFFVWFKISEDTNVHYIDNAWFRDNNFNMMLIKYKFFETTL